ncbi:MAG: tetraacyldisaccharide 4'-kinase [Alphaproteobacteria bacterium]|nr:tetraacyldisaccharide 4'-kinase [Alphaproteobacteria bacterium]
MYFIKPKFWDKKNNSFLSILLYPLSIIYYLISIIKKKITITQKFNIPIICVGNIYIGGTGKTSAAIEIIKILNKYKKVCFLTKGYGRKSKKDIFLNELNITNQNTEDTGDEALLLNKFGHVYISNNRAEAINTIIKLGYEAIILDDGFQDHLIFKNINILCFDSKNWVGNNNLVPSGPLREPLVSIKKANFVIIKGEKNQIIEKEIKIINSNIEIIYAENKIENIETLKNKNFIAFTGIGNPYSFFDTLLNHNVKIIKQIIYPDHFQFTEKNYKKLSEEAVNNKCNLITTEKDYVRINNQIKEKIYYTKLNTLLIEKESLEKELRKLF